MQNQLTNRKGHHMKTTLSMMIVLSMTLLMLTGCGTPYTNLCEQKGATMTQMTNVLKTVQDATSAEKAAPRLDPLVAKFAKIDTQLDEYNALQEIGKMDEGAQQRFMKRYGELKEMGNAFYAEVDRVRSDPEMFAPLEDVLSPSR
jgi:uncharacterized lipoprotein YajG